MKFNENGQRVVSADEVRGNQAQPKKSGYLVGRWGDDGRGKSFQLFSTHRTYDAAAVRLRKITGIGYLQIVQISE